MANNESAQIFIDRSIGSKNVWYIYTIRFYVALKNK